MAAREGDIAALTTPRPKNEDQENRARMAQVSKLRLHVAALRDLIYPPDEPEEPADGR